MLFFYDYSKMKKLLLSLMFCLATTVNATEAIKVSGVWGFAVGSTQGTYFRAILDQANREQSKYEFFFENKPGAGGALAARYVLDAKRPVILAHSSAFFIRPNLYPDTPYAIDQFKVVMVEGFSPAALVTKNKSLEDLKKQKRITIGTAGTGSTTHLMAEEFAKELPNIEVDMIHFQNTLDAYTSVQGGHIDATFEYMGDTKARGGVTVVGVTGKRSIEGIPALKDVGFPNLADLAAVFLILTPKDTPDQQVRELQAILLSAEKSQTVQDLYRRDYATKEDFLKRPGDYTDWFNQIAKLYKQFTKGIVIK